MEIKSTYGQTIVSAAKLVIAGETGIESASAILATAFGLSADEALRDLSDAVSAMGGEVR